MGAGVTVALAGIPGPTATAVGPAPGARTCAPCTDRTAATWPALLSELAYDALVALRRATADQIVTGVVLAGPTLLAATLLARGVVVWSGSLLGALTAFATLVGTVGVLLILLEQHSSRASTGAYRRGVVGHAHGYGRTVLRHEGGHLTAAAEIGARVRSARVFWSGGGEVRLARTDAENMSARDYVAFMRAGRYAAGTGAGCSHDDAQVELEQARLVHNGARPAKARRIVEQGDADARRYGRSAQVDVYADRLGEKGRL